VCFERNKSKYHPGNSRYDVRVTEVRGWAAWFPFDTGGEAVVIVRIDKSDGGQLAGFSGRLGNEVLADMPAES
jgi:hypothetical protein